MENEILDDICKEIKNIHLSKWVRPSTSKFGFTDRSHSSSYHLRESLNDIVPVMKYFDDEAKKVDLCVASAFIQGDCQNRPIFYFIDMMSDLYSTFRDTNTKLRCYAKLLTDSDIDSLENYQKALNPQKPKILSHESLSYLSLLEHGK